MTRIQVIFMNYTNNSEVEQIHIPVELLPYQLKNGIIYFESASCNFSVENTWRRRRRRQHVSPYLSSWSDSRTRKYLTTKTSKQHFKFLCLTRIVIQSLPLTQIVHITYFHPLSVLYITSQCDWLHRVWFSDLMGTVVYSVWHFGIGYDKK